MRTGWLAAIVACVALTACSGGATTSAQTTSSASPPRGGTLRVVEVPSLLNIPGQPPNPLFPSAVTLDPALSIDGAAFEYFRCCLGRTLLSYNGEPTDKGGTDLRPDLATALPEVSADGLTWTFRIRAGVHYAPPLQQREIVAADFIRGFQRAARLGASLGPPWQQYYSVIQGFDEFFTGKANGIRGLETPDAHTLVIRLTEAVGALGYRLQTLMPPPLPASPADPSEPYGVATGHDDGDGGFFVSSGPYMVEGSEKLDFTLPPAQQKPASGYAVGHSITLVRNPSWSEAIDPLRPAYVDRIVITSARTVAAADAEVDRGEADLVLTLGVPKELADPAVLAEIHSYQADPRRGRVDLEPQDGVEYLSMNVAVPPFDDLHVRRAVAYAIDKRAVLAAYGGSLSGSVTGHIATDSMEDNALLSFDPYRTGSDAARIAAARKEIALSRYDADGDGICDVPICRNIPALIQTRNPPALTAVIVKDLADIGVMITTRALDSPDAFGQLLDPTKMTPIFFLWTDAGGYPNADRLFPVAFAGHAIGDQSAENFSMLGATADQLRTWGYSVASVPSVDDRIAQCVALIGAPQTRCWTALDVYLVEDVVPMVPLISIVHPELVPSRLAGYSWDEPDFLPALDHVAIQH